MRSRLAILILFAVPPAMDLLAAPIPAPSAILQIEAPPKGESMEKHLEYIIEQNLTCPYSLPFTVWLDPEIRKLPSVAAKADAIQGRSWIAMNIRVKKEDGGRRLRLTFRGGDRREQVAILNTLLRVYIQVRKKDLQSLERKLRGQEDCIVELEKRIASGQHNGSIDSYREAIEDLRTNLIPATRADIDRYKQLAVIKWAR